MILGWCPRWSAVEVRRRQSRRPSMTRSDRCLASFASCALFALAVLPKPGSAARDPVLRADGDQLLLGQENSSNNTTRIVAHETALWGVSNTDDGALVGESLSSDGYGIRGTSPYIGVNAVGGGVGVYAVSDYGTGVQALTYDGVAVSASTAVEAGTALRVEGRAVFRWSGKVLVPAGANSVTVADIPLGAASVVLATLQERIDGLSVEAAVPDAKRRSFTLFLSRKVLRPVTVAWFVVD